MLNPKYLYLSLDLLTLLLPLLFSFYPKASFAKKWKNLWVAILIPGIVFIIWDEWFTRLGVWGFNERYLTGVTFASLPIEEVLFFICIPYACVFVYEVSNYLIKRDYLLRSQRAISLSLILVSTLVGLLHSDKWYTATTFLALAACLVALEFVWKAGFLGRFYLSYLFILLPFFIVNGILTGSFVEEPVVWYNNSENLGLRIGTIPVEDIFYGMLLTMTNVSILEWLQQNKVRVPSNLKAGY
jgi:lycopene cyclase domain-containing protein